MKNRKLILIVSLVLALTMSLGGTLAYLTDTDADVNTMVLGNVKIDQIEKERIEQSDDNLAGTNLQGYTQDKPLIPAVGPIAWAKNEAGEQVYQSWPTGGSSALFTDELKNVQDKIVFVENTGNTDAYVRTIFALEAGTLSFAEWEEMMHWNMNDTHWAWSEQSEDAVATINGNKYYIWVATYQGSETVHPGGILPDGETTRPSLLQVFLDSAADNDTTFNLDGNANGTYDILVLSQAIQKDGFTGASAALDEGFGEVNATNVQKWFEGDDFEDSGLPIIVTIDSAEKLQMALDEVDSGTTIVLGGNIKGDVVYTQQVDDVVIIDGNGYSFDGVILVDGGSKQYPKAGLIIKDIDFVSDGISADAVIRLGDGTNNTRYATNVTISGCTFDVKDAVAVKSYTGGDKNVVIENCTVSERMHSLCQLKNVEEGLVVRGCKVYAARGANFNNSFNVTVENCIFDVQKYALRFGADANTTAETFVVKDTTLKSQNVEGDPVVEVRAGAMTNSTMTFENVVVAGEKKYTGIEAVNFTIDGVPYSAE